MTAKTIAFTSLAPHEWTILAIAFLVVAFGSFLLGRRKRPAPEPVKAAAPPSQPPSSRRAEAEVTTFLGLLQEKGRLIDFLMDDVTGYSDAQVGSAARVVHQGCQTVLKEHLTIEPIAKEQEGEPINLQPGYPAADYRLLGNVTGQPPYQGVLVHKGWKVNKIHLPRTTGQSDTLPNIAAAQVELS